MNVGFSMLIRAIVGIGIVSVAGGAYAADGLTIKDPWIRAAPPNATVMAGYLTIVNDSGTAVAVKSASSTDFAKVEVHETVMRDGRVHMQHRPELPIAAHSSVKFEPNGMHLMLIEPKRRLALGASVVVVFALADGKDVTFNMAVKNTSDEPAHHNDHH